MDSYPRSKPTGQRRRSHTPTTILRGVPEADLARTMLLLKQADPLPGTSPLFRGLMAAGRSLFARAFARAYPQRTTDPVKQINSWAIIHAARLAEGIKAEEPRLIAFLDRAWNNATRQL